MWRDAFRSPLYAGLFGLLLQAACGGPETGPEPVREELGIQESAQCTGLSIPTLTIAGASSYHSELGASGDWQVSAPANGVWLDFYIDGVLYSNQQLTSATGTWYLSSSAVACSVSHNLQVRAYPMVVDSNGNRITCFSISKSATRSFMESCATVAGGESHSVALKPDGTVWSWGANTNGQLGDGTTTQRLTPVQVTSLSGVIAVAAGYQHTVALKQDGTVWAWGANTYGQLGDGTTTARSTPVLVASLSGVKALSAGRFHTMALKTDGTLWTWGYNSYGQLGDGTTLNRSTPVRVTSLSGVKTISAGYHHSMVQKTDGTVWAWGANDFGQLGDGLGPAPRSTPAQVSGLGSPLDVAAGGLHSVVLKSDTTGWGWGHNSFGQLGDGTTTHRPAPVQASGLLDASDLSAGYFHTVARKQDGTLWAWGHNAYGQLGDTSTTARSLPVQVSGFSDAFIIGTGRYHTLAVKQDGSVWTWGHNASGQLGDATTTARSAPVQVPGLGL